MSSLSKNIIFIGAGKIAHSLADALIKSGLQISEVISRTVKCSKLFADKFSIKKYSSSLKNISNKSGIFFLCVSDNLIKNIAAELSELNLNFDKSLFIHLSGAYNIDLLEPLKRKKGLTASFHIMQTFPSKKIVPLKNCFAAIETNDEEAFLYLKKLAEKIGLKYFRINPKEKIFYHLAGVHASNFLVGNIFSAQKIFPNKLPNNFEFSELAEPILKTTLKNLNKIGAFALSGPVDRGDLETIDFHIDSLKKRKDFLDTDLGINLHLLNYIVQSLILIRTAEKKYGKLNEGQKEILKALQVELKKII